MKLTRYYVIPDTADGSHLPTQPDAILPDEISREIICFLARYDRQGYYLNCKQERVPLNRIAFRVEPVRP
jgi:hypothetical protein